MNHINTMKLALELAANINPFGSVENAKARDAAIKALAEQPAKGCDHCNHALYSGTKCKNCGRVTEQAAIKRDLIPEQPTQLPFGVGGGLVAIRTLLSRDPCVHAHTAIQMIDAILAEQPAQQEPYGYVSTHTNGQMYFNKTFHGVYTDTATEVVAVYTSPPAQRKPLSNGEIYTAYITATNQTLRPQDERLAFAFARAIEAKLREKNT